MMTLPHILSTVAIAAGLFFMLIAAIGFVRLPDLFSRLHTMGVLDTLGAPLVLVGVAIWVGLSLTAVKLVLAIVFLYMTSPLIGHLLSRAAIEAGYRPRVIDDQTQQENRALHDASPKKEEQEDDAS